MTAPSPPERCRAAIRRWTRGDRGRLTRALPFDDSERREATDRSDEVRREGHHAVDILVRGRGLLGDAARIAGEEEHAAPLHLGVDLAAAPRVTGGRPTHGAPGAVLAGLERIDVPETLSHVGRCRHRPGDEDQVARSRSHRAFPVDEPLAGDAVPTDVALQGGVVVVDVDDPLHSARTRRRDERSFDRVEHPRAVHLRETECEPHCREVVEVVRLVIGEVRELAVGERQMPALAGRERPSVVGVADRLAEAARPRVEHDDDAALRVPLDLEEVVPAAERSQLGQGPEEPLLTYTRGSSDADLILGSVAVHAAAVFLEAHGDARGDEPEQGFEVAAPQVARREVGLEERDPAPDVDADRVRDDRPVGEEDAADRHPVAGMCVGHERHVVDGEREVREVQGLHAGARVERVRPREDGYPAAPDHVHRAPPARFSHPHRRDTGAGRAPGPVPAYRVPHGCAAARARGREPREQGPP